MKQNCILIILFLIVFTGCVSIPEQPHSYFIQGEIKLISENPNYYEIIYDSFPEYMNNSKNLMIRFLNGKQDLSGTGCHLQTDSNKTKMESGFTYPDNENLDIMILFDRNNNYLLDKGETFHIIQNVSKIRILNGISFEIGTNTPIVKVTMKRDEKTELVTSETAQNEVITKSEKFEYKTLTTHSFFQIFSGLFTYEEAEKKCNEAILVYEGKEYSGQMVYFNNKEEADFFLNYFQQFPRISWMGIHINKNNEYEWVNGKLLKETYHEPFSRGLTPDPETFSDFSKVRGWMGVNIDDNPFYWRTRYNNHTIGYTVRWDID